MLDGPDVSVALRGGVSTRAHAWDFVRWFADTWMGCPLESADGFGDNELAAVEAELGFELPAALREGYALVGRRPDLTRQQDLCRSKMRFSPASCGDAVLSGSVSVLVYQAVEDGLSPDARGLEVGDGDRGRWFGAARG